MTEYQNQVYKIVMDEEHGCIRSLQFGNREYIKAALPLFTAAFRTKEGDLWTQAASEMDYAGQKNGVYQYQSERFTAAVKLVLEDEIQILVSIQNHTGDAPEYVETAICVEENLGEYKMLWGFNEGVVVDSFEKRQRCLGFFEPDFPGMGVMPLFPAIIEMPFMAYYNEIYGLYMGAHDEDGNLKAIDFVPHGEDGIKMYFRFYTGAEFGADYEMHFPLVLKPYQGGWREAADIYRTWFSEHGKLTPIAENHTLPDWYGESPIVVTYPVRGRFDTDVMNPNGLFPYINGLSVIDEIAEKTDSKILVILMHWEGTAPWAPPYVWPPYGGEAAFREYVDALHKDGHLIGVYCSGMGYTLKSCVVEEYECYEDFEKNHLDKIMCRSPKEKLLKSKICTFERDGYDMCPSQKFTKDVLVDQTRKMIDAGVDYIQLLDQNHGGNSYFCYSKNHGHPPVPGKWQLDAVKDILTEAVKGTKVLLGCESAAAETFIEKLQFSDNRFNCVYCIGTPVPAYAYVYHEYVNNFMGNQVCVDDVFDYEKNPENLLMRMAYSFCAGDIVTLILTDNGKPTWNWGLRNFDLMPDCERVYEFARQANGFRKRERKYLHEGRMLKPTNLGLEQNVITEKNGDKLYADKLIQGKWLASDGTWAEFLANYNDYDVQVKYPAENCVVIDGKDNSVSDRMCFTVKAGSVIMVKQK